MSLQQSVGMRLAAGESRNVELAAGTPHVAARHDCRIRAASFRASEAPAATGDERDDEQNEKDEKQDLRDTGSGAGDAAETEHGGDQRDNEKDERVMQHGIPPQIFDTRRQPLLVDRNVQYYKRRASPKSFVILLI
jgi:hypothetical protein